MKVDDSNLKALFRSAVAYKNLGEFDNAVRCLKEAEQISPNDAEVKNELIAVKARQQKCAKEEKDLYVKMMKSF